MAAYRSTDDIEKSLGLLPHRATTAVVEDD
jgi:hypothetical protein